MGQIRNLLALAVVSFFNLTTLVVAQPDGPNRIVGGENATEGEECVGEPLWVMHAHLRSCKCGKSR